MMHATHYIQPTRHDCDASPEPVSETEVVDQRVYIGRGEHDECYDDGDNERSNGRASLVMQHAHRGRQVAILGSYAKQSVRMG